jgi:thioredoxin reductase (NADPH)
VALLDHVAPSPAGSVWGLGGTCVNVGCIPKKLMHQASLHGENIDDSISFGWQLPTQASPPIEHNGESSTATDTPLTVIKQHSWMTLRNAVKEYISSLNWGYRVQLRENNIEYLNAQGEFIDSHTLRAVTFDRKTEQVKSTVSHDRFSVMVDYLIQDGIHFVFSWNDRAIDFLVVWKLNAIKRVLLE